MPALDQFFGQGKRWIYVPRIRDIDHQNPHIAPSWIVMCSLPRGIAHGNGKIYYVTWQFHLLDDNSISVYWGHYFMENRDAAIQNFDTRDKDTAPQKFKVAITEILKRTIEVEANDQQQAEQVVSDGWRNSEYILGAEDFSDVTFDKIRVPWKRGPGFFAQPKPPMLPPALPVRI